MHGKRGPVWLAVVAVAWLLGCDGAEVVVQPPDVIVPPPVIQVDGSPPVVNVYPMTVVHETVTVVEEDSTPDVVYEVSGDPVPALIYEEGGTVAKKFSDLAAATTMLGPDLVAITQGGTSKKLTYDEFPLPTNWIGGLLCSMAADADADVTISPGGCRDSTDVANMKLAAAITKQLDAAWAVGTNAGGLDAGGIGVSTLYAIWLIKRSDTGVVDALFSLSFSAPAMPASYDSKRLIGAVVTDATSDIIAFLQSGDEFTYLGNTATPPPIDVNDATITDVAWEQGTLSVPPLCRAHISAHLDNTTGGVANGFIYIRSRPPTSWTGNWWARVTSSGSFDNFAVPGSVVVDANRQIDYAAAETDGASTLWIQTWGFNMLTRREPQ